MGFLRSTTSMLLVLRDPLYTERLASFLRSVGQRPIVSAPDHLEIDTDPDASSQLELEIYLRVWRVLYPDAEVDVAA